MVFGEDRLGDAWVERGAGSGERKLADRTLNAIDPGSVFYILQHSTFDSLPALRYLQFGPSPQCPLRGA